MPRKPTGRPAHRPPPKPELVAEALRLAAETTPEDAAETLRAQGKKVSSRSIRVWQKTRAGEAPTVAPLPPAAAPDVDPEAHAAKGRADALALVRRILRARDPSALEELDAGLAVAARGEADLGAWLARPMPTPDATDLDPLDACIAALAVATAQAERLSPLHPRAATVLGAVANLAARVEKINAGRPQAPTVDEVNERIAARRDEAVKKIFEHTQEARAKLTADRADLVAWAGTNLGPMIAAELTRRLDVMLGMSS